MKYSIIFIINAIALMFSFTFGIAFMFAECIIPAILCGIIFVYSAIVGVHLESSQH